MNNYWITFADGSQGCCQGQGEYDVKSIAAKVSGKEVTAVKPLPYPATPVIWQLDHPVYGKSPAFCFDPKKCCGHTSCPQRRSCTE